MQNSYFKCNLVKTWLNLANKVSKPIFLRSRNTIKANLKLIPFAHYMQISSAIMQNTYFKCKSVKTWPNLANKVSKPIFLWSRNTIKANLKLIPFAHYIQISSAIMQNSFLSVHICNSVNTRPNLSNQVTKLMLSWSRNTTKAIWNWLSQWQYNRYMPISSAITQNSFSSITHIIWLVKW